jgi:hypothetical protein
MEPNTGSGGRTAKHSAHLRRIQSFPSGKHQQFALVRCKGVQAEPHDNALRVGRLLSEFKAAKFLGQANGNLVPPTDSTTVVGKDETGRYVEPKKPGFAGGDVIEPPPGDLEGLGDNVRGIIARGRSA